MTTLAALSLHFPLVWYGFLLLFGRRWAALQRGDLPSAAHADPNRGRRADNPQHAGLILPAVSPADSWRDNIPLLSFLWLGRRARCCQARISWSYPLTELATGLLFILSGRCSRRAGAGGRHGAALLPADTGAD